MLCITYKGQRENNYMTPANTYGDPLNTKMTTRKYHF